MFCPICSLYIRDARHDHKLGDHALIYLDDNTTKVYTNWHVVNKPVKILTFERIVHLTEEKINALLLLLQ